MSEYIWGMEMTVYDNGVYQNDGALEVLYSHDHQIAQCIVRLYYKGIKVSEIWVVHQFENPL